MLSRSIDDAEALTFDAEIKDCGDGMCELVVKSVPPEYQELIQHALTLLQNDSPRIETLEDGGVFIPLD